MNQLTQILCAGTTVLFLAAFSSCSNSSQKNGGKKQPEKTVKIAEKGTVHSGSGAPAQNQTASKPFPRSRASSGTRVLQDNKTALAELKSAFRPAKQIFIVKTSSDTVIVGKAGTRIHIPAASFVNETGGTVNGEMVFSLIECYTPLEMFACNLSTQTVNGKLLETGGSVYMDAKHADEPLKLKRGRSLKIDFPKGEEDLPGMKEFTGVKNADDIIEWNDFVAQNKAGRKEDVFAQTRNMVESRGAPQVYLIELKAPDKEGQLDLSAVKLNNGEGTLAAWFEKQPLKEGLLRERFSNGYQVEVQLKMDQKGKVSEVKSTLLVERALLDELRRFLLKAPAVNRTNIRAGESYPAILKAKTLTKQKDIKEYYTKNNLEWSPDYDFNFESKDDYYTLSVPDLGWVNCDRFSKDPRPKTDMFVAASKETTVYMVFTEISSQIFAFRLGGSYKFSNIPVNAPIRLIAIRLDNGEVFLESKDTQVMNGNLSLYPKTKAVKEDIRRAFEF